uniref:Uncharacterized protein n=1 Tax=Anguilla anguilla TaxID=7936 RepID=A0A0E9V1B7_ANGAN
MQAMTTIRHRYTDSILTEYLNPHESCHGYRLKTCIHSRRSRTDLNLFFD